MYRNSNQNRKIINKAVYRIFMFKYYSFLDKISQVFNCLFNNNIVYFATVKNIFLSTDLSWNFSILDSEILKYEIQYLN